MLSIKEYSTINFYCSNFINLHHIQLFKQIIDKPPLHFQDKPTIIILIQSTEDNIRSMYADGNVNNLNSYA